MAREIVICIWFKDVPLPTETLEDLRGYGIVPGNERSPTVMVFSPGVPDIEKLVKNHRNVIVVSVSDWVGDISTARAVLEAGAKWVARWPTRSDGSSPRARDIIKLLLKALS